ncbi:type II toxin-antitoxin system Phd/YefM family antitoxin [Acinetobacter seifertii]|uniref:type II toxin-antitoxin system Phd/YefM family antitoxin n=1 Tax=Acinetobacter seifertii TaxID=1530123 RepID=UPI00168AE51D|nr:type II toxin-antitoxin system prevent-host-death family antitoxin [Acinetobacter seifertii]QNX89412.1 type II toxin-antitoxin system prevent-host-death family antitoxin [Acinetobacter seifertii]
MKNLNYSKARANLASIINQAIEGNPIEISRRGKESVIIVSKKLYEEFKKIEHEYINLKKK